MQLGQWFSAYRVQGGSGSPTLSFLLSPQIKAIDRADDTEQANASFEYKLKIPYLLRSRRIKQCNKNVWKHRIEDEA